MARERLTTSVIQAGEIRLVSVRAPAGFGKTSAMLDIQAASQQAGLLSAWVQLTEADNDFSEFLARLDAAVRWLEHAAEPLADPRPLARTLSERLAQISKPFTIFLDDLEVLHDAATLDFLRQLIEQLTGHGKFVVGSRSLPELGLGRLRAHGKLHEIATDQLRFTLDETRRYLHQQLGHDVSPAELNSLYQRTEGWITALWLAVLAMRQSGSITRFCDAFSGSDRAIADYLLEDVLLRQTPHVQEFLLKSSVLDSFSATLCSTVITGFDGARMLDTLARQNLFVVSMDASGQWYRYHSLFGEFLKSRMLQQYGASEVANVHGLAAEWFVAHAQPTSAIEHALKAQNIPRAIGLLAQHVQPLLWQGRVRMIARWFDAVPDDNLLAHPELRLAQAWALTFLHRTDKAERILEDMQKTEQQAEVSLQVLALRAFILALTDKIDQAYAAWQACAQELSVAQGFAYGVQLNSLASCHIYLGQFDEARRLLDISRQSNMAIDGASNLQMADCLDGSSDLTQGRLKQALLRYRRASGPSTSRRQARVDGQHIAAVFLAEALYEAGDTAQAGHLLTTYLPLIREAAYIDPIIVSFIVLCRIAWQEGRENDAMLWLHDCEQMGYSTGLLRMVASARLERARLALLASDIQAARSELNAAESLNAWSFGKDFTPHANDVDNIELLRWRLLIASGEAAAAATALGSALVQAEVARRGRRALKLRIVLAIALDATGDIAGMQEILASALEYAANEGFINTFMDEGAPIARLLSKMVNDDTSLSSTAGKLAVELATRLGALATGSPSTAPTRKTTNASATASQAHGLTRQELKVVTLLAEGLSNQEMADRLYVSVTTVKAHLRNINGKLNASSRTHAVAQARKLGALE